MPATWKKLAYEDDVILKTLVDANSVLYAVTDNSPAALAMAASTVVARLASGDVVAATVAEILTLLNVTAGATANAKITSATLDTGTDDTGFATALAISGSHNVPHVVPGTSGNFLKSDGTDWISAAPSAPVAHDLLSASHGDVTVGAVAAGAMIVSSATKWEKYILSVPAAGLINHMAVANGETTPTWKALFDATVPTTIAPSDAAAAGVAVVAARRDHLHAAPATFPPSSHAFSAHSAAAANISMAGYQLTDIVGHIVADAAALAALTGVKGKYAFQNDTAAMYVCTAIA